MANWSDTRQLIRFDTQSRLMSSRASRIQDFELHCVVTIYSASDYMFETGECMSSMNTTLCQ